MVYCNKCGEKIDENDEYCSKCGNNLIAHARNSIKIKSRPTFLKVLLILMIIGNTLAIFFLLGYQAYSSHTTFIPIILSALNLFFVYLLYNWNIIGFYGTIFTSFMNDVLSESNGTDRGLLFLGSVIGIALLYFAMKPVWHHFDWVNK